MAVLSPKTALEYLIAGSERYVTQSRQYPNLSSGRISRTGREGQKPFAAVLACSDSRCPVEHIFDTGVGDLFVIRVAGNQVSNEVLGSLEFCIGELGTRLIVVLGHTNCGTITSALSGTRTYDYVTRILVKPLKAIARAQRSVRGISGKQLEQAATEENIWLAAEEILRSSGRISKLAADRQLAVVCAIYDVETGKVHWMGEHPLLQKLVR